MANEFDLGEMLAERDQPKDSINVYLNEAASFTKAGLLEKLPTAKGDEKKAIEKAIELANQELEKSKYVFHLTGVPSRMREDIVSAGLAAFPLKFAQGSFVDENAMERARKTDNLLWAAQIESITNPAGKTNSEFSEDDIQKIVSALPTHAQNQVNDAIRNLTAKSELHTASAQDLDFL